ncbi:S16 family serine protease [Actinoallomurus sp. NPDC052274]|uniref:S16 family serine protease n=1 Tax=Actinoallomurus sp. NPDC052274 TaxID=3155420 RepID=UPI0034205063
MADATTRDREKTRRIRYAVILSLLMLAGFGLTGSPYDRIEPGPVIRIDSPERGSWLVTTVVVRHSTWFRWALAEFNGERTVRVRGAASPATGQSMAQAMDQSQTTAALVAAQLAGGRTPTGSAGLQVTGMTGTPATSGLHPGDVLLAAGDARHLAPLRDQTDLSSATVDPANVHVLVAPRVSGESLGASTIKRIPAASLAAVRVDPRVAATTYPLGVVQGPSAGLVLTLARVDALGSGGLLGEGRHVAGTGGVALDGSVTTVGEVDEKVKAAMAAHADVFFVPALQRDIAARAARGGTMRIVPVGSVSDAVKWLCAAGGRSPACEIS